MTALGVNNIFADSKKDKKEKQMTLRCYSAAILPPSVDLKKTSEQRLNMGDPSQNLNLNLIHHWAFLELKILSFSIWKFIISIYQYRNIETIFPQF